MIELIVVIVISLYLSYLLFEKLYHQALRKKLKLVIHVNGIRGKSTTVRLIDSGLRKAGYKVFSKTTGTIPMIINVDNQTKQLHRLGRANIIEQYKILRKAVKAKADVLVIECMAITPELQALTEKMLQSDITIITNVYHDHIDEMGSTLEAIATSLAKTMPSHGDLIISNKMFSHIYEPIATKHNTTIHISKPYLEEEKYKTFQENIEVSLMVADILDIDRAVFLEGFHNYHPDPGAFSIYQYNGKTLINGFAINDPDSIKRVYLDMLEKYTDKPFSVLLNIRDDRQSRTRQHIELLKELPYKNVYIMGNNKYFVKSRLKKVGIDAKLFSDQVYNEDYLFGMGNYKDTDKIINYYKKGEKLL